MLVDRPRRDPLQVVPVFYAARMVADPGGYSPSPKKPGKVVESWRRLDVPVCLIPPVPVGDTELAKAHDEQFVHGILSLKLRNGFGTRDQDFNTSLYWTNGAMLSAARRAIENGLVAVAPVSGFHHAGYKFCGGFCTFNGLMVTATVLLAEDRVTKIGILDFDQHWGNGTNDIIEKLCLMDSVVHYSPVMDGFDEETSESFLERIPDLLWQFENCDVVLYQAGADPHIDDPLGGWLTTEQLSRRDFLVFLTLRDMGVPVAWNLAGGYQEPLRKVLAIHDNTMVACGKIFCHE